MRQELVTGSLKRALLKRQPEPGLTVHSDGGGQYGSKSFRTLLTHSNSLQSMTRRDNHYDNAFAESLFSRLKAELLDGRPFQSVEQSRIACFEYIDG